MGKLRSINTALWSDPFIEDLSPAHKLLFIYLITNEKTNMLGVYEASVKKISFETGIDQETVSNGLKAFERVNKVKHVDNYIILVNFLKHQNFNTNMKKSAIACYESLPKHIRNQAFNQKHFNPSEPFESLSKCLLMLSKVEVEYEVEEETELEVEYEVEKNGQKNLTVFIDDEIQFEDFWNVWPNKVSKQPSKKAWERLKTNEKEKAMHHAPKFVEAKKRTTEAMPHACTYLNQKRFDDEDLPAPTVLPKNNFAPGRKSLDDCDRELLEGIGMNEHKLID